MRPFLQFLRASIVGIAALFLLPSLQAQQDYGQYGQDEEEETQTEAAEPEATEATEVDQSKKERGYYNWAIDAAIGNRYSQDSITFAESDRELVLPDQKSEWQENFTGRLEVGRRIFGKWRFGFSMDWYRGEFENYGSLDDRDGSLYPLSTFPRPPAPHANGDEFIRKLEVGKVSENNIMVTIAREYRIERNLRPYLKIGVGYARASFSDADLEGQIQDMLFREYLAAGASDRNSINCQDPADILGSSEQNFFFGACQANSSAINQAFWDSVGCSDNSQGCVIPGPQFEVEYKDGMQYAAVMGTYFQFSRHWAMNVETRYTWSKAKLTINLDHPFLGENTCLNALGGAPTPGEEGYYQEWPEGSGNWYNNCLVMKQGDALWVQTSFWDGQDSSNPQGATNYTKFLEGSAKMDRWEIFMGVRYTFGKTWKSSKTKS
jgi:opacity protein-like surface antigen